MSRVKTGKITVEAISIWCPGCNEFLVSQDGSSLIMRSDYDDLGKVITCESCNTPFNKPKVKYWKD